LKAACLTSCFWLESVKRALSDPFSLITRSKHFLKYSHRSLFESLVPGPLTSAGQGESQHLQNE
jgi:hypothetical protein